MEPFAHSQNRRGERHPLLAHLRDTAQRAAELAAVFEAGELANWAGLWHDIGKVHPAFQAYLRDVDALRGPDHSSAGTVLAGRSAPLLAFAIAGHHGGLPSRSDLKTRIARKQGDPAVEEALTAALTRWPELRPNVVPGVPAWLQTECATAGAGDAERRTELFIRMVFSALVDADFLDTEAHFEPERPALRQRASALQPLWRRLEDHHTKLLAKPGTRLNDIRNEVYDACVTAAAREPGLFRLTVPTGGGKTLSSMAFALRHALHHQRLRVAVAIPYTSIIEQTADVYRDIFGDAVLEHHSAVEAAEPSDPVTLEAQWPRLAAENWDVPIVVTTTVQLFESLFANRPGRCRKLHNLARSVIVLDEVQTVPAELLQPTLDVLRELTAHYGVSVVLCTATQPALAEGPFADFLANATEIAPSPERLFSALRRVSYEVPAAHEHWTWERVAAEMRGLRQCLAVVNTKADAFSLLDALGEDSVLHLSTSLCGIHRREVLARVRALLASGDRCLLVSTQVVEAGVDLDFPVVLRAVGPLDRIVQAAGRANREGGLGDGGGRVVVFDPEGGKAPHGVYRVGLATARSFLAEGRDLHAPATYASYFRSLFQAVDLDRPKIQAARASFDFPRVAADYRLIQDEGTPVVVRYSPARAEVDRLLALARGREETPRWLFRRLQPYLVSLRRRIFDDAFHSGLIETIVEGLHCWLGEYHPVRGLDPEGRRDPAEWIVDD